MVYLITLTERVLGFSFIWWYFTCVVGSKASKNQYAHNAV